MYETNGATVDEYITSMASCYDDIRHGSINEQKTRCGC